MKITNIQYVATRNDIRATWTFGQLSDGTWSAYRYSNGVLHGDDFQKVCKTFAEYKQLIAWFKTKGWLFSTADEIIAAVTSGDPLPTQLRGKYLPLDLLQPKKPVPDHERVRLGRW